ncbi:MAG: hypothetical protein RLZZ67_260 [Candidatus Parcubacteria bacterium]|jgi:hypothetical protein
MKYVFIFLLSLLPLTIFAHGDGLSLEQKVGDYYFDIGYSAEFISNEFIRMDLSLLKADTREDIPFSSAWVRIQKNNKLFFAGPIARGEFGKTGFSFIFPEEGTYKLFIRFEDRSKTLSESSFDVVVVKGESTQKQPYVLFTGLVCGGLALGVLGSTLIKKYV